MFLPFHCAYKTRELGSASPAALKVWNSVPAVGLHKAKRDGFPSLLYISECCLVFSFNRSSLRPPLKSCWNCQQSAFNVVFEISNFKRMKTRQDCILQPSPPHGPQSCGIAVCIWMVSNNYEARSEMLDDGKSSRL